MTAATLHKAATLILVRDREAAAPELLMIQRSEAMAFGAGAWVFPGGRVDPGDFALAAATLPAGSDVDDHAARIAAIRETIEEAGVAVGLDPLPDPKALFELRAALHAGEPFAALLDGFGLRLLPDALHPFCRWQPPFDAPKRFDTRFYIAKAPDEIAMSADGGETVALHWAAAEQMLSRPNTRIMFPTMCNLRRIATQASFADLASHAASFGVRLIIPELRDIDGVRCLLVPDGHGYPRIHVPVERELRA